MKTETILLIGLALGFFVMMRKEQELSKIDINEPIRLKTIDELIADTWQNQSTGFLTLDHYEQTVPPENVPQDPFFGTVDGAPMNAIDAFYNDPDPFNLGLEVGGNG